MTGQFWVPGEEGGYMYSDELSDVLRTALQPVCYMRQFTEPREADKPLHRGDKFYWNRYSNVATRGGELGERTPIPETDFTVSQAYLTIKEAGNSVPYTGKLEMLAKHDLVAIIENTLKHDARKFFDAEVWTQFKATPLVVVPASGTSTTALTFDTDGVTAESNNIAMGKEHVGLVSDLMKERNIPPYSGGNYMCVSNVSTFRELKNDLEAIHQYTETGLSMIYEGEIGRYEGVRFVEQTNIPKGGAEDSTTFNAYTGVADPWNNTKSSWAFYFGADTVLECLVVPEEIRAKIPGDFGRSKAIAWYFLGGYGLVHTTADDARIVEWGSAT